jgi:hypothetical protein
VIPYNLTTFPFGAGLGTAGPASSAPGASATTLYGSVNTETEFSFLTVETGIAGILVLTGFVIVLLSVGARRLRQVSDSEARVLLAALIAPVAACFALFFSSIVTTSVPIGPYLWAVGGIVSYWLIALPQARRREEEASAASSRGAGAARPTIAVAGARSSP